MVIGPSREAAVDVLLNGHSKIKVFSKYLHPGPSANASASYCSLITGQSAEIKGLLHV